MEVQAGFEPADNGVADRGLTTWLLHHTFKYSAIISKFFKFVKGSFQYFSIKFGKKKVFGWRFQEFIGLCVDITVVLIRLRLDTGRDL